MFKPNKYLIAILSPFIIIAVIAGLAAAFSDTNARSTSKEQPSWVCWEPVTGLISTHVMNRVVYGPEYNLYYDRFTGIRKVVKDQRTIKEYIGVVCVREHDKA